QREREQHEAGVGVDVLLARHMRVVGLPGVEIADEVGELVRAAMGGLVLLRRAVKARGVGREVGARGLAGGAPVPPPGPGCVRGAAAAPGRNRAARPTWRWGAG